MNERQRAELLRDLQDERIDDVGLPPGPWDRLAADQLSDRELAELRARAVDDPAVAMALEAFSPVGDRVEEDVIAAVLRAAPKASAPAGAAARAPQARRWFGALVALCAAAALVMFVPRSPALPEYSLEVTGLDASDRAEPASGTELSLDGALQLAVRPAERRAGDAHATVWVEEGGARRIVARAHRDDGGVLRLELPASDLGPGAWSLAVVVAPSPDAAPEDAGAQVMRQTVVVRSPP